MLGESYESAALTVGAIINSSSDEGHFLATEKCGLIRPYLKKIGLDISDLPNYRPVTSLTHLSKITERAMLDQLVPFLEEVGVVPHYQSAYRKLHSTETASCKIHDDLVSNTCHGKASTLVLLDLPAAFDTVDHQLLLSDFSDCGDEGTALSLLESYLENREQHVAIGESRSEPMALQYDVPQGSVLGPVLFTVYSILEVVVLPLIRPALNVGAMKLKSSKCLANIIISICSLFIGILMLMMGFFIVF